MATRAVLEALLKPILPYGVIEEDNEGQLIIYTGLREADNGELELVED